MYYLFVLGRIIALIFPRSVCYRIAKIFALLQFYAVKKDREAVMYNLEAIVDKKDLRNFAKNVFVNFSYYLADFFRQPKLDAAFIQKYVKIEGLDNLNNAIARGKGVISLTAHLGNYELGGAVTSLLGYPLHVVALRHKDERTNRLFNAQRQSTGLEVIPTGVAVKKCFSLLKEGKTICFLADRDFSNIGVKAKMFSKEAILPKGPAFFALKTGAYIVPSFFVRENKKFYRLIFDVPFSCSEEGLKSELEIIERYIPILERYIKRYPQQWYIFEKYWIDGKRNKRT